MTPIETWVRDFGRWDREFAVLLPGGMFVPGWALACGTPWADVLAGARMEPLRLLVDAFLKDEQQWASVPPYKCFPLELYGKEPEDCVQGEFVVTKVALTSPLQPPGRWASFESVGPCDILPEARYAEVQERLQAFRAEEAQRRVEM